MSDAMSKDALNVMFLCTRNSARSIIAEAILNREGRGKFRAFSAGSQPAGEVHPRALDLLRRMNFDIRGFRSKSWNEFSGPNAPKLDFVFTLCDDAAKETCPSWPGQPLSAQWSIPDPLAATVSEEHLRHAFADAFRMLHSWISILVNLRFEDLDRRSLQQRLDEIGRTKSPGQPASAA
jgi:protein-tyrosine-phosphatase